MSNRRTAPSVEIEIPADRSDLSTWTPQQVDTVLAEIHGRIGVKRSQIARERRYIADEERRQNTSYWMYREADQPSIAKSIARHEAKIAELQAEIAVISWEAVPFNQEYDRRPWTRAWIVTSSEGHVHNTMDCSTCNKVYRKQDGSYSDPTEFGWLPQVSGLDEAEIVDLAGEAACTVCYPSAPVESLGRPNLLDTAARLAEKTAKAAEKDAKTAARIAKGVTPDGSTLVVEWNYDTTRTVNRPLGEGRYEQVREPYVARGHKDLKTERAAEMWVVEYLARVRKYKAVPDRMLPSYDYPTPEAAEVAVEALADKRGLTREALVESLEKKIAAKVKNLW